MCKLGQQLGTGGRAARQSGRQTQHSGVLLLSSLHGFFFSCLPDLLRVVAASALKNRCCCHTHRPFFLPCSCCYFCHKLTGGEVLRECNSERMSKQRRNSSSLHVHVIKAVSSSLGQLAILLDQWTVVARSFLFGISCLELPVWIFLFGTSYSRLQQRSLY